MTTDWKYCQKLKEAIRPDLKLNSNTALLSTHKRFPAHLIGRGRYRGLHSGKVPGVDKICAEIMRALDIKMSWLIHLSNDIEISGKVMLNPKAWVGIFVFKEGPRGYVLVSKNSEVGPTVRISSWANLLPHQG